MKKIILSIWLTMISVLSIGLLQTNVKADGDYDITNYTVNIDVDQNGNALMTQNVTYDFSGGFHGVYYNQALKGIKGVGDPEITVHDGDSITDIQQSTSESNDTFSVDKTADNMKLKVYHVVSNKKITFVYKYKLYGVITNYRDIAELNWKIIGGGWDHDLHNVKITINLPANNIKSLRAWAHGNLNGFNKVDKNNGKVILTADTVDAGDSVESHIIFPTTVTSLNSNTVDKNAKDRILVQEKKLAEEANYKRQMPSRLTKLIVMMIIFLVIIIFALNYYQLVKYPINKHSMPTPLHHWFDAPNVAPSMANIILDKANSGNSQGFTGDVLVEVNKHNLKIEKEDKTFRITALNVPQDELIKFMIETIGDGTSVTIKEINTFAKRDKKGKLYNKFENWKKRAARHSSQYIDINNKNTISRLLGSAVFVSVLMVVTVILSVLFVKGWIMLMSIISVITILITWAGYLLIRRQISYYTEDGEQIANELQAFRRMFEDVDDLNLAEVGDLILWEQILPYAVAFGISKKVVKALKLKFGTEAFEANPGMMYYYWGIGRMSNSMNLDHAFSGAFSSSHSANSSASGGSGGFSGGSSGGFGGGSGGGAF
ncbi:DUF2207 domain-containing protein [Companilactobacillus jidongensis]|uniref:DUF2207 domain-containing protein n=1 Tax=Companilactobacillus jidongensis TaxID=2486006 RepID=UPI000F7B822C|nr:DUF2207 domain-containing protein [Companilactobacillus jidongensis]